MLKPLNLWRKGLDCSGKLLGRLRRTLCYWKIFLSVPVLTLLNIFFGAETSTKKKYRRYKWEAYCGTNRRRTAVQTGGALRRFPFSKASKPARHTALQMGGALRYKLGVYRQYFSDRLYGLGVPKQSPQLNTHQNRKIIVILAAPQLQPETLENFKVTQRHVRNVLFSSCFFRDEKT